MLQFRRFCNSHIRGKVGKRTWTDEARVTSPWRTTTMWSHTWQLRGRERPGAWRPGRDHSSESQQPHLSPCSLSVLSTLELLQLFSTYRAQSLAWHTHSGRLHHNRLKWGLSFIFIELILAPLRSTLDLKEKQGQIMMMWDISLCSVFPLAYDTICWQLLEELI